MSGRICPCLLLAVFCLASTTRPTIAAVVNPEVYIKSPVLKSESEFGTSVAISGDTMVVGASTDSSGSSGINGDESDESIPSSGAVYVFIRNGNKWEKQAFLKASNPDEADIFGVSVAIDGDTVVVGANGEASNALGINGDQENNEKPTRGAIYVFVRNGTTWTQQAYIKTGNTNEYGNFGYAVGISGDTIVAGAPVESTFSNGDYEDQSHAAYGATYIFKRNGTTWSEEARLTASNAETADNFGYSVAISGDTIVIGAIGEASNSTSINWGETNNDATYSGAAYVFVRKQGTWLQEAYLKAPNAGAGDQFGYSVALAGDTTVIGAPYESSKAPGVNGDSADNSKSNSGAAYVFSRSGTVWSFQSYLKASSPVENANFGYSVGISGELVIVGAPGDFTDGGTMDDLGAVYVFARKAGSWSQFAFQKSFGVFRQTVFGNAVAIARNTLLVGAYCESYVVFSPFLASYPRVGAVYTYSVPIPTLEPQSLSLDAGAFRFSFYSPFEADFSVLSAREAGGGWTALGPARKIAPGRYEFQDTDSAAFSGRFYRISMEK